MNRNRLLLIGLAALLFAAVLTLVAYRSLSGKLAAVNRRASMVAVAAKDLAIGSKVEAGDVRMVQLPTADLPLGYASDPAKVIGRGVIAPLVKNEIMLDSKLAGEKAGAGLPAIIPPKMRAVSVQVNEVISVAGFVTPGTRVDVLLTGSPTHNAMSADVMTTTVLENVEVLAAGQKIEPNAEGKAEKVPVITLLVSPEDAQKLTLASMEGKIQLALRNPLDADKENKVPVRNASLYRLPELPPPPAAGHGAPVKRTSAPVKKAAAPPSTVYVMEIIRGEKKDTTNFQ